VVGKEIMRQSKALLIFGRGWNNRAWPGSKNIFFAETANSFCGNCK
jgi:hypothetical protein